MTSHISLVVVFPINVLWTFSCIPGQLFHRRQCLGFFNCWFSSYFKKIILYWLKVNFFTVLNPSYFWWSFASIDLSRNTFYVNLWLIHLRLFLLAFSSILLLRFFQGLSFKAHLHFNFNVNLSFGVFIYLYFYIYLLMQKLNLPF